MSDDGSPPLIVNGQLAQVLVELGKLSTQSAVIQAKQDSLREKIDALPIPDHEARLRSLERFKWMLAGASLLGGSLAGGVVDLIMKAARKGP